MRLPGLNFIKVHHVSHAALALGTLTAAAVFFAAGALARLLLGPVSLGPFAGTLQGAIEQALPGITLSYDQAALEWTRDEGRINLVVLGAKVFDRNGQVVAAAPKADIDLAARSFLSGHVRVQRITLVGVELSLVHMKEGGMRLGAEGDKNANDVLARLNDVIEAKSSATSSLKSFAVRDARLSLFDEPTGVHFVAPHASLMMSAKGNALGLHFESDVVMSSRSAHVTANLTLPADKTPIEGDALITGLDLRALAANAPMFKPLGQMALSANLAGRYSIAPGARLAAADFDLTAAGELPFPALKGKRLHIRQLRLSGHYDGAKDHLALERANLEAQEGVIRLKGAADFHYDEGSLSGISGGFATSRLALDMPGIFVQPVSFQSLEASGRYDVTQRQLTMDRVSLSAPGLALSGSGSVSLGAGGETPGVAMSGKLAELPVKTLLRYWPLPVAEGTRGWIDANIFQGTLGPFVFETHFAPGMLDQDALPDDTLKLTFPIAGVEGNYLSGLTHLTNVSGNAVLLGDTFTADFEGGRVGNLIVRVGRAVIPTLHLHGTAGQFSAHVDGQMADILALIDMKPLGYATRFGIDPKQTHGSASTDLSFTVPMLQDLPVDAVGISVKAQVSDFAVTLGRLKLANGQVDFDIDNDHLHQTGSVMLADSRFVTDWVEDFKTSDPITTRVMARGVMTDAVRQTLGIGVQNIVTGPVTATAELQGRRGQLTSADIAMDLSNAALTIPILHLGKPQGLGANGRVSANFAPGDILHDEAIRVTGPNISATGTANFDRNGSLSELNFTSVRMGPQNDLSFTLTRTAAGNDYVLRGHSLDGSLIGRDVGESGPTANGGSRDETPTGPFHIDAKLDRLAMRDGVAIAPFNLDLAGIGDKPSALILSGGVGKTGNITGSVESSATGRRMTIETSDAGQLIQGLFAFESIKGGNLKLVANLPGHASDAEPAAGSTPDYQGTLDIDNFQVLNQPLLARLFSAGSFTGLGDLMSSSGGISLENLDVPFSSKNNVISVHDVNARGRAVCATADGYIDRPKNQVALKGSLIPACGINSLFGSIPVLGTVLGSKKGEGLFGVTYSATGNADEPKIEVNPLSALAPGYLRRAFQGHIPNSSNAPSNQPAAPNLPAAPSGAP